MEKSTHAARPAMAEGASFFLASCAEGSKIGESGRREGTESKREKIERERQ